jgi:hypothetical protein
MSNYTKATNFATKDTLPPGDSGKIVKGTEIDSEFNAISSAVSSKADTASPTFTGTPAAPTAVAGTNTTQLATTAFVTAALQAIYPVGSIYINAGSSTNPSTLLGFGTWEAFGAGRVLIGQDASNSLFDTLEETGGSADAIAVSHTHTATSTSAVTDAGHDHTSGIPSDYNVYGTDSISPSRTGYTGSSTYSTSAKTSTETTGITVATSTTVASTGSSGTNANYQPFITVKMWKRTA